MARRRRSHRIRLLALGVVTLVEAPAIFALHRITGSLALALGPAALLSAAFLLGLTGPFEDRPKSALHLYGALWPFFVWFSACLFFIVLGPLAYGLGKALALSSTQAVSGALVLALAFGVRAVTREPRLVEVEVAIPQLPEPFWGYRVGQLSDVHCGSYTPPERVRRWVEMLVAEAPDLLAVTGDLITAGSAYVELTAEALSGLTAPDGVFACMGNHDYFTDEQQLRAALRRAGLTVLRNEGVVIEREGAKLYVAGVDDTWTGRADVEAALAERPAEVRVPSVLLAHDPNLFPEAARHGVDLMLSGHTHGGQIAVPGFSDRYNLARLITRYTAGLFRIGNSTLYVSRGAGTTGPPLRIFAPAELTILTLRPA